MIFEDEYPIIHYFAETTGWIEIGQHEVLSAFVRAYDEGGTVYEGRNTYSSMAQALQDLNAGIKAHLDDLGIQYD
ncbi:MAG: hypothetical protein F6K42_03025 [Leptolyngbya sp. SIO1D8]|nr:hypothetical protein [Leptolyngbya sp. SIO1D8]